MLISPLMDLLVIAGSGFLLIGSVLKAIDVATRYSPAILGFSSLDFLLLVGVCWGFALVLAARTWVQLNEPELLRQRRERLQREAAWRALWPVMLIATGLATAICAHILPVASQATAASRASAST